MELLGRIDFENSINLISDQIYKLYDELEHHNQTNKISEILNNDLNTELVYNAENYINIHGFKFFNNEEYNLDGILYTCYIGSFIGGFLINHDTTHDLKSICFDPNEFFKPAGEATRKLAPTFLIAITTHDRLSDSHQKLLKTDWFDTYKKSTDDYDPLHFSAGKYELEDKSYSTVYVTNENKKLFDKFLNFYNG